MGSEFIQGTLRTHDPLNAEWVTILMLLMLGALAYTNLGSPKKWRLLSQAMFRMRLGRQTLREEIDLQDRTFIGLLLVAIGVLSLFGWQAFIHSNREVAFFYLQWVGLVSATLIGHGILLRILIDLFGTDRGLSEHLSTGLLLFILNGMALLPVTILIAYRPDHRPLLLFIGVGIILLLLIYRWVRGAWIGLGEGVSLRYIFIYLCAAEMIPVLLLVRAFR